VTERAGLLRTTIKERLVDARKHLIALIHNAGKVGIDFDRTSFEQAWSSAPDSDDRTLAYAIEAACDDLVNGLMQAGQNLCALNSWTNRPGIDLTKPEILRQLNDNGVISVAVKKRFQDICDFRDTATHDYVGVTAQRLHEHVTAVLRDAPELLEKLAAQVN
jgi:uncharacterized protein YutE (UPF0331/DUF86 family)